MERFAAILLGAGVSRRMSGQDKLWHPIAGRPLLGHTLDAFATADAIATIVLVVHATRLADARALAASSPKVASVIAGGARRRDSAEIGLGEVARVASSHDGVLLHDGARPLVSHALIRAAIDALAVCGAAVPVMPAADTIKKLERGLVVSTVDRSGLFLAQTPQIFTLPLILRAYAAASAARDTTDDASVVELTGERVATFAGERTNIKVTTTDDLCFVEALLLNKCRP